MRPPTLARATKGRFLICRSATQIALGALLSLFLSSSLLYADKAPIDTLRANYLVRFFDFIRWERPLSTPNSIGVIGSKKVAQELRRLIEAKDSKSRSIRVVDLHPQQELEGIDLIYVGLGQRGHWDKILSESKAKSIVTVSDELGFLKSGGLIEFTNVENRLRFYLNLEQSNDYGVSLSSKLIQLALK